MNASSTSCFWLVCIFYILSACNNDGTSHSSEDAHSNSANSLNYTFTLKIIWSSSTHPVQYPAGAHFSGIVGASHNQSYTLFQLGQIASAGVQQVAETGGSSTLRSELESKKSAGHVDVVLSGSGPSVSVSSKFQATVSKEHPLISLVTMIAPSPDWFIGISNVNLLKDNTLINKIVIPLYPLDAGTDSGLTYASPNSVMNPVAVISPLHLTTTNNLFSDKKMFSPFGEITIEHK